jgi:hypothetical protein
MVARFLLAWVMVVVLLLFICLKEFQFTRQDWIRNQSHGNSVKDDDDVEAQSFPQPSFHSTLAESKRSENENTCHQILTEKHFLP